MSPARKARNRLLASLCHQKVPYASQQSAQRAICRFVACEGTNSLVEFKCFGRGTHWHIGHFSVKSVKLSPIMFVWGQVGEKIYVDASEPDSNGEER
jgi:hypothetical protein